MASQLSRPRLSSLRRRLASGLLVVLFASGCAEVVTPPPAPRIAVAERPFLLPPARGYPGEVDAELAASVEELHGRLLT